jgi:hypothetical protein
MECLYTDALRRQLPTMELSAARTGGRRRLGGEDRGHAFLFLISAKGEFTG